MNSFELNKVLGAILGTCLFILAINIAAGAIFSAEKPAKPGYAIVVQEKGGEKGEAKPAEQPMEVMMATASLDKGKQIAKQCQACHTFEKGGPNRIGPNLWNIVGDERGKDRGGYNFSAAMKAKGGKWTFSELYQFLKNPRGYIPGTNMTFAGLSSGQQRADVIDFLDTLSDNPLPLPKAAANAPAAKPATPKSKPAPEPTKPAAASAAPAPKPAATKPATPKSKPAEPTKPAAAPVAPAAPAAPAK